MKYKHINHLLPNKIYKNKKYKYIGHQLSDTIESVTCKYR